MKEHFVSNDNVLDKSLIQLINNSYIAQNEEIQQLELDVLEVVADIFTAGD